MLRSVQTSSASCRFLFNLEGVLQTFSASSLPRTCCSFPELTTLQLTNTPFSSISRTPSPAPWSAKNQRVNSPSRGSPILLVVVDTSTTRPTIRQAPLTKMASFRKPQESPVPARRRPRSPTQDANGEGTDYGSEAASRFEPARRETYVPVAYPVAEVAPAAENVAAYHVDEDVR